MITWIICKHCFFYLLLWFWTIAQPLMSRSWLASLRTPSASLRSWSCWTFSVAWCAHTPRVPLPLTQTRPHTWQRAPPWPPPGQIDPPPHSFNTARDPSTLHVCVLRFTACLDTDACLALGLPRFWWTSCPPPPWRPPRLSPRQGAAPVLPVSDVVASRFWVKLGVLSPQPGEPVCRGSTCHGVTVAGSAFKLNGWQNGAGGQGASIEGTSTPNTGETHTTINPSFWVLVTNQYFCGYPILTD